MPLNFGIPMSTLMSLYLSTSVYFGGFTTFFLYPHFGYITFFCMSTVWLRGKEPLCPFFLVFPSSKVYTVWDSLSYFRPSNHILFSLAVINISSNPFSLLCPPYRVHYNITKIKDVSLVDAFF